MNINDLHYEHLKFYWISCGSSSTNFEEFPFAYTFLEFAREDLKGGSDLRNSINAVGNATPILTGYCYAIKELTTA